MNKIINSSQNITPFGGLSLIYNAMNCAGIDQFLNQQLGHRSFLAQYSYSDIIFSLFGNALTQGSYIADLEKLKARFSKQEFSKIPSPDTVEYVCQELKTLDIFQQGEKGVVHQLNYNNRMNETLVALAAKTNQLSPEKSDYTLDYDNVIIEHDKQDAQYTYKHSKGYQPGIAFIGRHPIHIENRNGNTPARFQQKETLQRCLDNLDKYQIKIKYFRGDSASYQKEVVELLEKKTINFYIRMMSFEDIRANCRNIKDWQIVKINHEQKEVTSIMYEPFSCGKEYRVVVTRKKREDEQMDLLSASAYTYQGIITDDFKKSEKEVIEFYNQRGDAENSNRYMLNDFNLHHLPFPDMATNTVFMYMMGMCATLFEWIKKVLVKNKVKAITIRMRIKAVCFHYITVASVFIKHSREKILKVYSNEAYCILQI